MERKEDSGRLHLHSSTGSRQMGGLTHRQSKEKGRGDTETQILASTAPPPPVHTVPLQKEKGGRQHQTVRCEREEIRPKLHCTD